MGYFFKMNSIISLAINNVTPTIEGEQRNKVLPNCFWNILKVTADISEYFNFVNNIDI